MKFYIGLATGAALGVAGAVAYSARSGRDLRGLLVEVRDEVASRDADALGMRLVAGASQLEAGLARLNERLDAAIAEAHEQAADAAVAERSASVAGSSTGGDPVV